MDEFTEPSSTWLVSGSLRLYSNFILAYDKTEPSNVVPVLLSAAFLETQTLVEECLNFCHNQTNQILDAKQSFSCLNDQLIEKYVGTICKFV